MEQCLENECCSVELDTSTKLKLSLVNKELENMNSVKMNVVTNTRDINDMKLSNPNTAKL